MATRRKVGTEDFAAMLDRMIRSYAQRVGDGDSIQLAEMMRLRDSFDEAIGEAIDNLRAKHDYTWTTIGEAAGTTRQAAQQRWGRQRAVAS